MDKISVSVIMPSLNVRNYIEKSVRSVMNQTLKNIEIICIDAGSSDGTIDVIKQLMQEDSRIYLVNSPMKSYGYQVNLAIKMAKGEYIAVVETDDYINIDMYEDLYKFAKENSADIVKGNYLAFWTQSNGEEVFLNRENLFDKSMYNEIVIPVKNPYIAISDWYLWTGIYKKSLIVDNNILLSETRGAAFQDIGFLHRINMVSKRSFYTDKTYYCYCLDREESSSNSGRGIEYSYYEYKKLLDESWSREELVSLYARMAGFFSSCFHGIEQKDLYDNETRKRFDWFRDKLGQAILDGIIDGNNVYDITWKQIFPLPSCIDEVYQRRYEIEKQLKTRLGKIESSKIIIFGCGNFGYYAYKWLKKNGYMIVAFSDNNKALWGKNINGLPIISPSQIDKADVSLKILIANEKHSEDILKQLISLGYSDGIISVYSG